MAALEALEAIRLDEDSGAAFSAIRLDEDSVAILDFDFRDGERERLRLALDRERDRRERLTSSRFAAAVNVTRLDGGSTSERVSQTLFRDGLGEDGIASCSHSLPPATN